MQGALDGFFSKPYPLWFIAEDPVRTGELPSNIVEVTQLIVDTARRAVFSQSSQSCTDQAWNQRNTKTATKDHKNCHEAPRRVARFPRPELLNATNRANVSAFTYDPTVTSREPVPTFFSKRTIVMGGEFMFR